MKNIICLLTIILIVSCSESNSNDLSSDNNNISVSSITRKNYNISSNAVLNSTIYNIGNNKILNSTSVNQQNSTQINSNYMYVSNLLTQINTFSNGDITSSTFLIYNTNSKLIEYRSETFNNQGEIQTINKNVFDRIQDTIYNQWSRKTTNSLDFQPIMSSKIVLNQNNNRTYFEYYDHVNNENFKILTTYDTNSNIIEEKKYLLSSNGLYSLVLTNSYSYNTSLNTLSFILSNTYSRENLMLLYHLQSSAINEFNVKSYSPNTLNNYTSSFDNTTTFNINNTIHSNNYCKQSDFKTLISNTLFSRFTYEFSFN